MRSGVESRYNRDAGDNGYLEHMYLADRVESQTRTNYKNRDIQLSGFDRRRHHIRPF